MARIYQGDRNYGAYVQTSLANLWDTDGSVTNAWAGGAQQVVRWAAFARRLLIAPASGTIYVVICDTGGGQPSIGVYQNGAIFGVFPYTANTPQNQIVTVSGLTPGATVEVWAGKQAMFPSGNPATNQIFAGTHIVGIYGGTTILETTPTKQVVILGDSIVNGQNITDVGNDPTRDSAAAKVRIGAPAGVQVAHLGASGLAIKSNGGANGGPLSGAQWAARVSTQLGTAAQQVFMDLLGANEYLFSTDTLAHIQAEKTALYTTLHATNPGALIKVVSPIPQINETNNNAFAWNLPGFRTMCATIAAGLPYVTHVDGTSFGLVINTTDYNGNDFVHLRIAGATKLANGLLANI